MAMKSFIHVSAASLKEAAAASCDANGKAVVIAGGTDLLGVLKDRIHSRCPETVVDLKTIPGLSYVVEGKKGLRIGALTTLHEVAASKTVQARYRVLAEAARAVGSPQIRNTGTVGGNICQEPRCWYYRTPDDRFHCLRKGGTYCGALLGENRYHSIFGGVRVAAPACTAACPGNVEIAAYLGHARKGELDEAARIILESNPIPAMTGRVCPHRCESKCNRGELDEAVSIRAVERFVGDYVLDHAAELMTPPKKQRKQKVAIVGSGPAGLAAAYYLREAGYRTTVFDRMPQAGGMLTYCIPAYRLPKELVGRQIAALERMGIEFKLGVEVGHKGATLRELRRDFDSVFLATGAWRQKPLEIERSERLTSGMEFLIDIGLGRGKPPGDSVLVIGGGNVAVDVAVSARRAGAKHVVMACLEARDEMPAFAEGIAEALKEGVRLVPGWGPHRVLEAGGRTTGLELVRCTSVFDARGRFQPSFDPARRQTLEADQIILAIGQRAELGYAGRALKADRGLIVVDKETQATSIEGVFAGGEVESGPASVIHAIAAGRRAASAIDSYLGGGEPRREESSAAGASRLLEASCDRLAGSPRAEPAQGKTLSLDSMQAEALRCLHCSCVAVNASDLAPALVALGAKIKTTKRAIPAEEFFAAVLMKSTVLDADELVKEIEIPAPPPKSRQSYLKFRIRNAIDFPIVGLASVLTSAGGRFKDAKIVLGAVAPILFRMKAVEGFLKGKTASEETAASAGELAVRQAQPLAKNRYKAQIVKALLRRAILGAA